MRALPFLPLLAALASPALAQDSRPTHTPAARAAIADFARCVVGRSPARARSTLTMDFTQRSYRAALRALSDANRDCHGQRSTMRAGGLPFAAAMAEALLLRDPAPLNVRLLRAAASPATPFSPSDRVAICIARSDPDGVARLLQSPAASPAETAAAKSLQIARQRCSPPGVTLSVDDYGLRSILATATYRLLAAQPLAERG